MGATVKPSKFFSSLLTANVLTLALPALAGSIDMDDPRRTVGREENVRIDAQLVRDTVSPGSPIGITYQIENLSAEPVAIADKVAEATYDADTLTITLAVGSEVPRDGKMPRLATIAPGEKKVFHTGATPALAGAASHSSLAPPRYVQVKVSILRDLVPFAKLRPEQVLPDELFDKWFESNDSIFLNAVPVRFSGRRSTGFMSADQSGSGGF